MKYYQQMHFFVSVYLQRGIGIILLIIRNANIYDYHVMGTVTDVTFILQCENLTIQSEYTVIISLLLQEAIYDP